jgi:putative transposase
MATGRLTILLRREGWRINAKRVYRIYRRKALAVRNQSEEEASGATAAAAALEQRG